MLPYIYMENLMTRKTASLKLACSERFVDRLIKSGLLNATKIGRLVRIKESDLQDYIFKIKV